MTENSGGKSIVYRVFGVTVLEYLVPTAATAGLLTVIANLVDGMHADARYDASLLLGSFLALLFAISTGHSARHNNEKHGIHVLFDVLETISMTVGFHSLGLVTGTTSLSHAWFFYSLFAYLLVVFIRRLTNNWREKDQEQTAAAKYIVVASSVVGLGSLTIGILYPWLAPKPVHGGDPVVDTKAGLALFAFLVIYVSLLFLREMNEDWVAREKDDKSKRAQQKEADAAAAKLAETPKTETPAVPVPAPPQAPKA